MNKHHCQLFLFALLLTLAGCQSNPTAATFTPITTDADLAVIYLYRPASMSNAAYSPAIYIDGEHRTEQKNGHYSVFSIQPGQTVIEVAPYEDYSGITRIELKTSAGNDYYLRLDTNLSIKKSGNYEPYERSFNLIVIGREEATREIAVCCMPKTRKSQKTMVPVEGLDDAEGFSVDKTQNPFSH